MIICSRCGKENQDQFKYCLGCGLKLAAAAPAPAPAPAEPVRATSAAAQPSPVSRGFGQAPVSPGRQTMTPSSGPANAVPAAVPQKEPSRPRPAPAAHDMATAATTGCRRRRRRGTQAEWQHPPQVRYSRRQRMASQGARHFRSPFLRRRRVPSAPRWAWPLPCRRRPDRCSRPHLRLNPSSVLVAAKP